MADIQNVKCKNQRKTSPNRQNFALTGNRGRRIERRCLNLHRKCINNRFCACAVQMLLTMAANATKCSTFEIQYGKSTSTRRTAIRHCCANLTDRVISRMHTNSSTASKCRCWFHTESIITAELLWFVFISCLMLS